MSEKQKGDTSRPNTASAVAAGPGLTTIPPPTGVVKNPLLSASVTGLTFDDFPNKPLLLPPVAISREPKQLVTIGSATDVDTESLDEINLNASIEETQTATDSSAIAGNIDPNANPLWSDVNNPPTDSILSQAASSFSALPSVASSVLSTFSKRISEYSASNSRERTPISDNGNLAPQLDIQPAYLQQQFQTQPYQEQQQQQPNLQQQYPYYNNAPSHAPPPVGADPASVAAAPYTSAVASAEPPPSAPKFYTPTEVPTLPAAGAANPPPPGGQNTYRLAAKKKLYAPIPGFSEQTSGVGAAPPAVNTLSSATPLPGIPPLPPQPAVPTDPLGNPLQAYPYEPHYQQTEQHTLKQEERRTGGLFSNISNLVPSGVLQNISGLVQSATGTFAQGTNKPFAEESTHQPQYGYSGAYQQPPVETSNVGAAQYFGVSVGAPPASQFYPPPVEANQSSAAFFAPPQQSQLPLQQQQQHSAAPIPPPAAPPTSQLFAPPAVASVAAPPPPPTAGFVAAPPKSATPDYNTQHPSASKTPVTFFDPTKQPSTPASFFGAPQQPVVNPTAIQSTDNSNLLAGPPPPLNIVAPPTAATVPLAAVPTFDSTQTVFTEVQPPPLVEPPKQPNLFATPAQISQPPSSTGIPLFQQQAAGSSIAPQVSTASAAVNFTPPQPVSTFPPPTASPSLINNQTPLPPTAGGTTSFRLQKGTRLYKSPLTSAETAPVQIQTGIAQPLAPPTSYFNPFGALAPVSAANPIAPPTVPSLVPSYFIAQPAESSVGLFTVDQPEPVRNKNSVLSEPPQISANFNADLTAVAKAEEPQLFPAPSYPEEKAKAEEPQLFPAPSYPEEKPVESVIPPSLTAEDLGAIIQQQTIEPEIPSASDLETKDLSVPLEHSPSTKEQSESLHKAIDQLSLSEPSQEIINKEQDFQPPQSVPVPVGKEISQSAQESSFFNPQTFQPEFPNTVADHLSESQESQIQQETESKSVAPIEEQLTTESKPEESIQKPILESHNQQTELSSLQETVLHSQSLPSQDAHFTQQAVPPPPTSNQPPVVNPLLPPILPPTQSQNSNPFRKNIGASPFAAIPQPHSETQPKLANFFADALGVTGSGAAEFNIFTPSQQPPLASTSEPQLSTIQAADAAQTPAVPAIIPAPGAPTSVPSAAGFFGFVEPTQSSFFQPLPPQHATEFPTLPPLSGVAPPPLASEAPSAAEDIPQTPLGIPPPIGFDNILPPTPFAATQIGNQIPTAPPSVCADTDTVSVAAASVPTIPQASPLTGGNTETQHSAVVNSFSNYFNQTTNLSADSKQLQPEQQQQELPQIVQPVASLPLLADTSSSSANFFDTFAPQPTPLLPTATDGNSLATQPQQQQQPFTQTNEEQRLQNFFNNPPQRENNAGVGDLGYDLVHSGLAVRHLGSVTSVSNVVEPPSSSCSEFSELNNSNVNPRILPAELLVKRSPEKSVIVAETQQAVLPVAAEAKQEVPVAVEPIQVVDTPLIESTVANSVSDLPLEKHYEDLPEEVLRELRMANLLTGEKAAASAPPMTVPYSPAVKHWFYKRPSGSNKFIWTPFSHYDSALLEITLTMDNAPNIVAVEGGRYDVNISERTKTPVYWQSAPIEVRRCSWFYKGTDSKMVPYEESIADLLENEYKQAVESGEWHKKIVLSMNEQVTFHGPTVIVHFQQQQSSDAWGGTTQTTTRPRVVKRDLEEFSIEQGESQRVDHLLLMVHGIGAACDLKMRSVDEVVDDFRNIAQALVQSHYKNSTEMGLVGRVEVLPISWHSHLHSEEMGIDEKLRSITLESIPKLRNFTNNTLLDVLFYTSPKYCQKIMNTVAASMNEVYNKYRERHPDFNGGVSVAGHSLGSLILFDLLCHQKAPKECEEQNLENPDQFGGSPMDVSNDDLSVTSYTMGPAGTGQPFIHYTQLNFQPKKFFALGSPIGMFVTIRGIDKLGVDFRLPTCSGFYNIFHPFDPVAYRIEALVNPDLSGVRPVLIPHHKGRKRMHLELKETMTRVGADLKQRFLDTFKNTLESVSFLGGSTTRSSREAEETMSKEVDKVLNMQIDAEKHKKSMSAEDQQPGSSQSNTDTSRTRSDSVSTSQSDSDMVEIDFPLGKLNDSKRIDYVLQEAPLEFINEYIFALGAHVCYWESEDTILFVMKEIYTGLGISPDNQVPQQTMTIERPSSRNSNPLSPISEKR